MTLRAIIVSFFHWMAWRGSKMAAADAIVRPCCCSGVMSSAIQKLRPCVATIRSASRGWISRSSMRTLGEAIRYI